MEIKKFDEYTKEEQKELFNHWWHYYGKVAFTLAELEEFNKLVDEDPVFVKNAALLAFVNGRASIDLLCIMRDDSMDELRKVVAQTVESEEYKEVEDEIEAMFIQEVVGTYNNPEPSVPMASEDVVEELQTIFGDCLGDVTVVSVGPAGEFTGENEIVKTIVSQLMDAAPEVVESIGADELADVLREAVGTDVGPFAVVDVKVGAIMKDPEENDHILSIKKVKEVYKYCILSESEVSEHEPIVDFTMGEGVAYAGVFNSERLAEKKEEIASMVDELADIEKGPSFLNLCMDKNGRQWTGEHFIMDCLVQLGVATEALYYTIDRDMWDALPGGVPFIARSHEKDNADIKKHAPKEYKKIAEEFIQKQNCTNEENA